MKNSLLALCYLVSGLTLASELKVDLVKIKLNPTDALGIFKVNGGIQLNVDSKSLEVATVDSEFSVKALGLGMNNVIQNTYDINYDENMNLVYGDDIDLPGFNKDKVLASLLIQDPNKSPANQIVNYNLKLNYLLAFGKAASSECQKSDSLNFQLTQNRTKFTLTYPGLKSPVSEIKLFLEALGKEKKLSRLELTAKDKSTKTITYKNCKKV